MDTILKQWGFVGLFLCNVLYQFTQNSTTNSTVTPTTHRQVGEQAYQLLEQGKIILYQKKVIQNKSMEVATSYYFSLNTESPILPLTLANLQYVFRDNPTYYNLLELRFAGREQDLTAYDTIKKMYKVNYWLATQ